MFRGIRVIFWKEKLKMNTFVACPWEVEYVGGLVLSGSKLGLVSACCKILRIS